MIYIAIPLTLNGSLIEWSNIVDVFYIRIRILRINSGTITK